MADPSSSSADLSVTKKRLLNPQSSVAVAPPLQSPSQAQISDHPARSTQETFDLPSSPKIPPPVKPRKVKVPKVTRDSKAELSGQSDKSDPVLPSPTEQEPPWKKYQKKKKGKFARVSIHGVGFCALPSLIMGF